MGDAVVDVVGEDLERDRLERRVDSRDLGEDIDAVAVAVDHLLDSADLSLDAVHALDQRVFVGGMDVAWRCGVGHDSSLTGRKRRRRREFETTKMLENAMAAAAMTGLTIPETASGMAATL